VRRLRTTTCIGHTSRNAGQARRGRVAAPGDPTWTWPGAISAIGAPWPDRDVMDIAPIAGWCRTSRTSTASRVMPARRPLRHRGVIPRPPCLPSRFSANAAPYPPPPPPPSRQSLRRGRSRHTTPRVVVQHYQDRLPRRAGKRSDPLNAAEVAVIVRADPPRACFSRIDMPMWEDARLIFLINAPRRRPYPPKYIPPGSTGYSKKQRTANRIASQ